MLEKRIVNKYTLDDCRLYIEAAEAELTLTGRRLELLKKTQARNPSWAAYDKYAGDIVGIDIRIEEQYAVSEMLEEDLRLLQDRERVITIAAAYTGKAPKAGRTPIQLALFGERNVVLW